MLCFIIICYRYIRGDRVYGWVLCYDSYDSHGSDSDIRLMNIAIGLEARN